MYFLVIIIIIAIDQLTKYIIYSNMNLYESIPVIENVFHITYTQNFGAAFSILQNQQSLFIWISLLSVIVIFGIMIKLKNSNKILLYSLSLIAGGAIGNLIDRIRFDCVTDFFDLRIWPIFNIADVSIVCGTALLAYYVFLIEPKIKKQT